MTGWEQDSWLLAFLRAARDNPQDDAPRVLLAAWLDERRDFHRAEFLRLQCALHPGSPWPDEAPRSSARQRVAELLGRSGGGWLGPRWRHGGVWHRGLLSVELDRLRLPDGLAGRPVVTVTWRCTLPVA